MKVTIDYRKLDRISIEKSNIVMKGEVLRTRTVSLYSFRALSLAFLLSFSINLRICRSGASFVLQASIHEKSFSVANDSQ